MQNNNPFTEIAERLHNIEGFLLNLDERLIAPTTAPDADQWQQGAEFAAKELGLKVQTVYQQIDKIPHRKIHGKLYFKRSQLQNYIEQKGGQAQ